MDEQTQSARSEPKESDVSEPTWRVALKDSLLPSHLDVKGARPRLENGDLVFRRRGALVAAVAHGTWAYAAPEQEQEGA